jgi:hypothetical protein
MPVVPSNGSRAEKLPYDKGLYNEQRRRLRRRPSRREVGAPLVGLGVFAGTFGQVEHDRGRRPSELVA